MVLDTLNRSIDGSESKDDDMGKYLTAAEAIEQAFGCVVPIVHHCGIDGSRPRGHTSITGTCTAQIAVKKDDATGLAQAMVEFMKEGPADAVVAFKLKTVEVGTDEDGDPITSCVVEPAEAIERKQDPKLSDNNKLALKVLRELIAAEGGAPPKDANIPSSAMVVSAITWRERYYEVFPSTSPTAKAEGICPRVA